MADPHATMTRVPCDECRSPRTCRLLNDCHHGLLVDTDATDARALSDALRDLFREHGFGGSIIERDVLAVVEANPDRDTGSSAAKMSQAQDSLRDQIIRVLELATNRGEYDAADFIQRAYFGENTDA